MLNIFYTKILKDQYCVSSLIINKIIFQTFINLEEIPKNLNFL